MMKSLRLHRQRRQEDVVQPAGATSASTDTKPTTTIGLLASKGTVDPSNKSSSASLSTEGSSSIQSSSHDGEDGLVLEEPLPMAEHATATARQTVGVHADGPASKQEQQRERRNDECSAGQQVRAFPRRGCLRVTTQHESLQQKYDRRNVVSTRGEAADRSAIDSTTTPAVADAGSTEYFEAASQIRSVKFSDITVYSHQWILGDNPSVTSGPPISIEWNAFATSTVALDDYENSRQQPPRHHSELQVPGGLRAAWMLRAGFTPEEIATVEKQVRIVQQRRSANLPRNPNQCVSSSPYNPCGKYNAQIKKGMAKLWTRPKRVGRKTSDEDDESEAVIYVDVP